MDCSLPGSSVHGIFQARVLDWGAIAFSDVLLHIRTIRVPRRPSRQACSPPTMLQSYFSSTVPPCSSSLLCLAVQLQPKLAFTVKENKSAQFPRSDFPSSALTPVITFGCEGFPLEVYPTLKPSCWSLLFFLVLWHAFSKR